MRKLLVALLFITGSATAQDSTKKKVLNEVVVYGKKNIYKIDSSSTVAKMPLRDLDNPQVYNSISKFLLKDQQITNLQTALNNATGISRLWESTGRGGDGAEYYSMRGFALQPTLLNGMPNIVNGTIDPVNIETIEVIKGPSGTLYGGAVASYGGLINIVTKKAYEGFGGEIGFMTGTNNMNRFTAEINAPISQSVWARVNAAYHYENTFQDAGFRKSIYVAPSFKINANKKLTFLINTEFRNGESANGPMIFLNRYNPLSFSSIDLFEKNYKKSFTTNSLSIKNPGFAIQAQANYQLSKYWTSQTVVSSSNTKTDGYYHYLWDASNGDQFTRYISKRNGATYTTDLQQNIIGKWELGTVESDLLIGFDYLQSNIENNSTGWVANGVVSLVNGTDGGILTSQKVDNLVVNSSEGKSRAVTKIAAAYVSNLWHLTDKLSAMTSLRVDNFKGLPLYAAGEIKSQTTLSPKLGLIYQPVKDKWSLFANYMNGFTNLAPATVSDVNGQNPTLKIFDPEHANQWEVGTKASLYKDRIAITASYYSILVTNKTMTDPTNPNNTIQGGEVESKGVEFSVTTNPIEGLSIVTGFSHNDSKVTKDATDGGYLNMRPEEAGPADLFNIWANYKVGKGVLRGLSIGFGANHASKHYTLNRSNIGQFALPEYTVLNSVLSYNGANYTISVKVDNLTNQKYYRGWSTVTPQVLRTASLGFTYKF